MLTAAVLLACAGCGQEQTAPAVAPVSAPAPVRAAAQQSAEPTSFGEVTAQLDPGGSIYVFLNTSQWLAGLSDGIRSLRDPFLSMPGMGDADRVNIGRAFDVVTGLVKASGIESVSGVGMSGIALEKGYYQTKFVLQSSTPTTSGVWTVFGAKPRPLHELDWLPADTAWATGSDLDAAALWRAIDAQVAASGIEEAKAGWNEFGAMVKAATGKLPGELIGSFGGEVMMALTLDVAKPVRFPMPDGSMLEFPAPALAIMARVKDDTVFDLIDRSLKGNDAVIRTDEGGLRMRTLPVPLPLPVVLRPTVARQGDELFIATSDELLKDMLAVKSGKRPGLKAAPEFQRLARGMPADGNSFAFVSERLGTVVMQVQKHLTAAGARQAGGDGAPLALMEKMYGLSGSSASYGVGRNTGSGFVSITHGHQPPANAVLLPLVVAPAAIVAGLTLPALAKAKSKAQTISCVNNMKQICLGVRIYATDHNDLFPTGLLMMKEELSTPRVLICPQDPRADALRKLTWADFDPKDSSYEYVGAGVTEATPQKVILRCRYHNNVGLADGSVQQNPGGSR